ncbi:AI-2E family transporter [Vitiosangium sp. GDMCC 1.1324]|uniref:AI-2E family transporter n=1 Tax=Vitiosangium sp. (strain GDMCC 1.1324) TaxID=2138576 RepID=UPI000D3C3FFB|nr:AI-2E family transporter [Vitiosangium sp. GDMCC 1.1324]PTL85405.1 AI-2E family transporter [Vitiosangium sp. GDMCC 1.1324]
MTGFDTKRWSNLIFAGLFGLALILFSRILLPFLMPVLLGGFLVVLFLPLQDVLFRTRLRAYPSLCAGLSTVAIFLLILVPLAVVGWLVAREVLGMLEHTQVLLDTVDLRKQLAANLPRGLRRYVPTTLNGTQTEQALMGAMASGASVLSEVLGAGTELVIDLFLMTVAMYYFFLDGRRLWSEATQLVPLDKRYIQAFAQEFTDVAHAIIYGNTITALVQGALGVVGLMVVKVPHAGVWGAAMALVAMVPVGGTALVWGPIGVMLLLTGKVNEGVFLLAWGAFVVGTIDNIIRPRLCGSRMTLHPLLVFLSMFGGLAVFGMMGLLVGPLIASIFMAMVRIYRRDFLKLQLAVPQPESETPALVSPVPVAAPQAVVAPASTAAIEG